MQFNQIMDSFNISVIFQNQLFADGLECILQTSSFRVFKSDISEVKEIKKEEFVNSDLWIIEINWPFQQLESVIDEVYLLAGVKPKIVLITNVIKKSVFKLVSEAKIQGIILKCSRKDELLFGISQILEGHVYYSSKLAPMFLNSSGKNKISITKREKQILSLIAEMKSTEKIANLLSISKSTVKTHRRNLMRKFDLKNMLCLLRLACRENLLEEQNDFCALCYKKFISN